MPLKIQDRDVKIIQEIAECRFLSLNQIADLCFEGNKEAARKRLEKLTRAEALNCVAVSQFGRIFSLSRMVLVALKHFGLIRKKGAIVRIPVGTLEHELAIRDFRVSVLRGVSQGCAELKEFTIDSHRLSFATNASVTRPDGFFQVKVDGRMQRFFFEVDAGSEPLGVLLDRLKSYRSFYRSGRFARRIGESSDQFRSFPFRVIFLFKTVRRRDSALKRFSNAGYCGFTMTAAWDIAFANPYFRSPVSCENTPNVQERI